MQFTPTVVVGVSQAGINVINQLHDSDGLGWRSEYDEYFDFVAIDSNPNEVRMAPDKATQVHIQSPAKNTKTDIAAYPYLAEYLEIGELGAQRQRPVGRYKLDSGDSYEAIVEAITEAVKTPAEAIQESSKPFWYLNVVHVHSLSGGTGSGTFPLVANIIDGLC